MVTTAAPRGVVVELTVAEMAAAGHGAITNWVAARIKGEQHRYAHKDLWGDLIGSVAGEMAVAKHDGVFWTPSLFRQPAGTQDVGACQVRWTRHDEGHLTLYEHDANLDWFVLVVGEPPVLRLVGWVYAGEGKRAEYRRPGNPPYYWTPQSALYPMQDRPFA